MVNKKSRGKILPKSIDGGRASDDECHLAHRPVFRAQVMEQLLPQRELAYTSVSTIVRILEQKGYVTSEKEGFGLTVDASRDERLDVLAETGAAIRYFSSLHRQFNDWGFAPLAYNVGSTRVQKAIRETGSRDVWEIIDRGYENDPDYVS